MKEVKQININENMKVLELVEQMNGSGVMGAGRIAKAVNLLTKMITEKDCKVFFGFAGAMVPGGMKNIVIDMLRNNYIDLFVSTGANLTHDLVEALGYHHYQGKANVDDKELNKKKIDRIYDSYMPNEVYEGMENFFAEHWDELSNGPMNIKEFLWKLGSFIENKDSILRVCFEKKIPIFCPGIADSGIGLMVWGHLAQGKKIKVGAFDDLKEILDFAWTAKKAGIFYIGGGVPKNYIQQAMQFAPEAASYGIQITMDRPEPGGSSGAELREGISWGKMSQNGEYVDVICDSTIALPLIYAAAKEKIKKKKV
ncbi:MAG: deoxyhypusine synthase [Nanoarchaeota archaeon]|nr:deoxyhypusine synthase [Nanoarchaeota archaeon]